MVVFSFVDFFVGVVVVVWVGDFRDGGACFVTEEEFFVVLCVSIF